ncbi:uncharacterized protein METZ01_LOCUS181117 [marine metagenome]|uniref:Uncharacterized protein n=1 Tax=marine metagenome TaxID=408172 RepID=A0A382CSI2_9ZZZZ
MDLILEMNGTTHVEEHCDNLTILYQLNSIYLWQTLTERVL